MKLIEVDQLKQRLDDVQLLEVGAKTVDSHAKAEAITAYEQGHLPNAKFVDLAMSFSTAKDVLGHHLAYQCPNAADFIQSMHDHELSLSKPIVIYDRAQHIWAARLAWVLEAYGHTDVAVLHGGFQAWQAQQLSVQTGAPQAEVSTHQAPIAIDFQSTRFAHLTQVQAIANGTSTHQLLNVLRPEVFSGQELRYHRAGHIPNSIHLPFSQFLDEKGRYQSRRPEEWRALGLELNQPIVIYCGSGVTASGAALGLSLAGAKQLQIYDGSMSEWSAYPDLPLLCQSD